MSIGYRQIRIPVEEVRFRHVGRERDMRALLGGIVKTGLRCQPLPSDIAIHKRIIEI